MAQDNSLRILSSKFNEKRCIALSFDSWIGDTDEDCVVKGMLHVLVFLFPQYFPFLFNWHSCCMVYEYRLSRTLLLCIQYDPVGSSCLLVSPI